MKKKLIILAVLSFTRLLFSAEPFLAPPVPSGSMVVKLYPTENVTTGQPTLITFGIPFTRGSLTPANLSTVRVLSGEQEIAAHVEMLTPWRHLSNDALNGTSVRVALLQITHSLSATYPAFEMITVKWGEEKRSKDIPDKINPRSGWHRVTGGTFASEDSVDEPDIFRLNVSGND